MANSIKSTGDFYANSHAITDPRATEVSFTPTDPLFANQWYLNNTGQSGGLAGIDINVTSVWDDYTGNGITVAVYDDAVQYTHPDLDGNYDTNLHITIGGAIHDPFPTSAADNHGTAVAGLIGAENNGTGTVGVAFGATLAGVGILNLTGSAEDEAMNQQSNFDVINHSWGFSNSFIANQLNPLWSGFFGGIDDAVQNGRGGLGTIIVNSAGNNRAENRNTNDSDFTSARETIAVAAIGHNGNVADYSTEGASLLISAPSSGPAGSGVWTTDRTGSDGYSNGSNEFGNSNADYTATFGGTSAAAPLLSGVVALMLEANPLLGWRDVQEILSYSAQHTGTAIGSGQSGNEQYDWGFNGADNWNGGGLHFSNDYGAGLVDALAAVRLAETWNVQSTSANEASATGSFSGVEIIPDNNSTGVSFTINVANNIDVESIELIMQGNHTFLGDLIITITSPDGTVSNLLNRTGNGIDLPSDGWTMTSNAFRGELSAGDWVITISDNASQDIGVITSLQLNVWGDANIDDDVYIYTNEFSDYAGAFGHSTTIFDASGTDTINVAAVSSASTINLSAGTAIIDGTAITSIGGIENVEGGDFNDQIFGNQFANVLNGRRGDDFILGLGGDDTIFGGAGNDTVSGSGGNDIVNGGGGNDEVIGGTGNDELSGGTDDDTLNGNDGDDKLFGNSGIDLLLGGDGIDELFGGSENDRLFGGAGNDILDGGNDDDLVSGDEGNDTISGGFGNDTVLGGTGDDTVYGNDGNDLLFGQSGIDTIFGGIGNDSVYGGLDADTLRGDAGNDTVSGSLGNDTVSGNDGNDLVVGGDGDDTVFGGTGDDTVNGNAGDDLIFGEDGIDILNGGAGNDELYGGTGADDMFGADGDDFLNGGAGNDRVIGGAGIDNLFGGAGNDTVSGGDGDDKVNGEAGDDVLFGAAGIDVLNGGAGNDALYGGTEIDFLYGFSGNDDLFGQDGDDRLTGGTGNDSLNGGAGNDIAIFAGLQSAFTVNLVNRTVSEIATGDIDTYLSVEILRFDDGDIVI